MREKYVGGRKERRGGRRGGRGERREERKGEECELVTKGELMKGVRMGEW